MGIYTNKQDGEVVSSELTCDECGEMEVLEGYDFMETVDWAAENGWSKVMSEGTWMNFCSPECEQIHKNREAGSTFGPVGE